MYMVIVSHRAKKLMGGGNFETLDDGGEILAGVLQMFGDFEWEDVDIHIEVEEK